MSILQFRFDYCNAIQQCNKSDNNNNVMPILLWIIFTTQSTHSQARKWNSIYGSGVLADSSIYHSSFFCFSFRFSNRFNFQFIAENIRIYVHNAECRKSFVAIWNTQRHVSMVYVYIIMIIIIQYISYKVVDSIIHSFAVHLNGVKPIFALHYTDLNSYLYSMDLNVCGCILTYMLCWKGATAATIIAIALKFPYKYIIWFGLREAGAISYRIYAIWEKNHRFVCPINGINMILFSIIQQRFQLYKHIVIIHIYHIHVHGFGEFSSAMAAGFQNSFGRIFISFFPAFVSPFVRY